MRKLRQQSKIGLRDFQELVLDEKRMGIPPYSQRQLRDKYNAAQTEKWREENRLRNLEEKEKRRKKIEAEKKKAEAKLAAAPVQFGIKGGRTRREIMKDE